MKKPNIKRLRKDAWKAFSDYIRERDNWTCVTCGTVGKGSGIHAGHFLPKKICGLGLRFDETNCHAQCYACNRHYDGWGARYSLFIRAKYGPEYDHVLLGKIAQSKKIKPTVDFYTTIVQKYTAMREALLVTREFADIDSEGNKCI